MVKKLSQKDFDEIYEKVPRLCVDLVILGKEGIILTKRSIDPWKGLWHFPGGGVLFGEIIEQAAKRVAKTELNIDISLEGVLGYMEFISDRELLEIKVKGYKHSTSIVLLAKPKSENPSIKLNNQASEFKMFKDKIPQDIIKEHRVFIKENYTKIFKNNKL